MAEISQKKLIQFLRGNATSKATAISSLKAVTFGSDVEYDGTVIVARYTEDSVQKSIFALYAGSKGATPSVTIFDNMENLVKSLGVNADGTYSAITDANYISGATSLEDADKILDKELKELSGAVSSASTKLSLTSPNETLSIETTKDGTTADVNHDGVTIKQAPDSGITFDNTDTVDGNDLYVADAIIEETFTVLGGNVGQLTSGTKISGGTTVIELLKKMLVKEADCTPVAPTSTLSISETTSPVEVGTKISQVLTATYADGKFTGSTADYGKAYSVTAGCASGDITYKRGNTTLATTTDTTYTDSDYVMPAGTTTWSITESYGASTVTPKKNNGTDSTKTIAAGTTASSSKSITAYYKWYVGNTTAETVADVDVIGSKDKSGWLTGSTSQELLSTWKSNGTSIYVAVPSGWSIDKFMNKSPEANLEPNFKLKDSKTVAIGGDSSTTYSVQLWVITSGAVIETGKISIKKG